MKKLYINNKQLTISDEISFPFTQTVNDLDDISVIGLMASKSISIPRCSNNDEIFGYICQINRIAISDYDNKIGVSFNQTKKANYTLFEDSVKKSEGIVKIINISDTEYTIELYDKLIEILEDFEGDKITGTGFLSELDIIISGGTTFSMEATALNVKNNLINTEVKPCFNISDFKSAGTDILVNYVPISGSTYPRVNTISSEITPIQFRTLKNWELEYAVPLLTVFRSINDKYNNIIEIDTLLETLFSDVHFNMGKPKSKTFTNKYTSVGGQLGIYGNNNHFNRSWGPLLGTKSMVSELVINDSGSTNLLQDNGKYTIKLPFNMMFNFVSYDTATSTNYLSVYNGVQYLPNLTHGTKFGELFVDVYVQSFDPDDHDWPYVRSSKTRVLVPLFANVNTTIYKNSLGKVYRVDVNDTMEISVDYYPKFNPYANENYFMFDFTNLWENTVLFRRLNYHYFYPTLHTSIYNTNIEHSALEFRTGDILNGQSLYPNISIKDFIISVAKYFNLGLMNNDGKLKIHYKQYTLSNDVPLLEVNDMQVNNFDFSILRLSSDYSSDEIFEEYEKITKKAYCEQIINTGYNIKSSEKEIKFNAFVPSLMKDTNYYAYSDFCQYKNNGQSRSSFGNTKGGENKVQLGFINIQNEDISVADDTYYEANMSDNGYYVPTQTKWLMVNEHITYYESEDKYYYPKTSYAGQSRLLNSFNTFSPYKFNSNNEIIQSLEMNKPDFNYANITDEQYSSGTTHYQTYFKKIVNDIYDVDTHILNVRMYINKNIDIYSIINYRNSLYKIKEISEYDPTKSGLYDVKLLRVKDITNYGIPEQPDQYTLSLDLTYDYMLNGDKIAYYPLFQGGYSEISASFGDMSGFSYISNVVPNELDDYYYISPYTHFKEYSSITKVVNDNDIYLKLENNYIQYKESTTDGYEYRIVPFDDTSIIHLETGVTSGAWLFEYDPPLELAISGDTTKIESFNLFMPRMTNLSFWNDNYSYAKIGFEMFFNTSGGNETFTPYFRAKFGMIEIYESSVVMEPYYVYLGVDSGSVWTENVVYTDINSGQYTRLSFDAILYLGTPISGLTFNDLNVKLLSAGNAANFNGYDWAMSFTGNYDDTIYASGTTVGDIVITDVADYSTIYYTELINNGNPPITVELSKIQVDYQYNLT